MSSGPCAGSAVPCRAGSGRSGSGIAAGSRPPTARRAPFAGARAKCHVRRPGRLRTMTTRGPLCSAEPPLERQTDRHQPVIEERRSARSVPPGVPAPSATTAGISAASPIRHGTAEPQAEQWIAAGSPGEQRCRPVRLPLHGPLCTGRHVRRRVGPTAACRNCTLHGGSCSRPAPEATHPAADQRATTDDRQPLGRRSATSVHTPVTPPETTPEPAAALWRRADGTSPTPVRGGETPAGLLWPVGLGCRSSARAEPRPTP